MQESVLRRLGPTGLRTDSKIGKKQRCKGAHCSAHALDRTWSLQGDLLSDPIQCWTQCRLSFSGTAAFSQATSLILKAIGAKKVQAVCSQEHDLSEAGPDMLAATGQGYRHSSSDVNRRVEADLAQAGSQGPAQPGTGLTGPAPALA